MRFLRSCLTVFCFGLFGVGGIVVGMILFPIFTLLVPKEKKRIVLSRIVRGSWIFFVNVMIFLRLISVDFKSKQKFEDIKGTVIVANHPTLIDVVLLVSKIPNCICVVKNGLLKNPFIKNIIRSVYLVNGESPEDFLKKGGEILSAGMNIVIFPEGTRTKNPPTQKPSKLYRGFAQLAVRFNAPVLPVHITCDPLILGKNQKWYNTGVKTAHYTFRFLPIIKNKAVSEEDFHHQAKLLTQKIEEKLF
ncbi:MAG: 1-acyl-sn-glycerol-3-phosphate acyltransferase [Alphaproteobacteria bacterium]|nr:1-acyl-sn-glycerol-3-phosphate acyltransferase [Alphaproteobacteria bacterium]